MKKQKHLAALLAVLLLCSGCAQTDTSTDETSGTELITQSETETETEAPIVETNNDDEDLTDEQIEQLCSKLDDMIARNGVDFKSKGNFEFSDKDRVTFFTESYAAVRQSTQGLFGADEISKVSDKINNLSYSDCKKFESQYGIIYRYTTALFNKNSAENSVDIKGIYSQFQIPSVSVNGFLTKQGDTYLLVIDPAYMYGIPVMHNGLDEVTYDINGLKLAADSACFSFTKNDIEDFIQNDWNEKITIKDGEYCYVKISGDMTSYYSFGKGYITSTEYFNALGYPYICGKVSAFECITPYIESEKSYDFIKLIPADKDPAQMNTYNAIMDNINTLYSSDTYGITLLDLDFDGTPEVIQTNVVFDNSSEDSWDLKHQVDVKIYKINGRELVYLDTLYNTYRNIYETGNVIGLKTLEDGSKAWYTMSRMNRDTNTAEEVDYLFKLNGDKLEFTELFRCDYKQDEYGYDEISSIYYFGKAIDYTSYATDDPPYDIDEDDEWIIYEWNGLKANFGLWELYGFMRQDFCKDIEMTFMLYSNWITDFKFGPSDDIKKMTKNVMNERLLESSVAKLVDDFYLGNYDAQKMAYHYDFLGDYAKPVIYLYPEETTDVSVKLHIKNGALTCTYPDYNNGWDVTAYLDGTLINKADGDEYSYLYWEGKGEVTWDMSEGFVVKGSDTAKFLKEKLAYMGLTPREYNEFIVYWLPLMQDNEYNLIKFQTDDYTDLANLKVTPAPDSTLRIFMTYTALDEKIEVPEQKLETFERHGFTVVEWGGAEVK